MVSPLIITLFLFSLHLPPIQAQNKPDQVIEIFRHGARTPATLYDPQWNGSEIKQLTPQGMFQHYNLGKSLAERYSHLISSGYNPDEISVLANNPRRCVESAMSQVSSLFRGKTSTLKEISENSLQDRIIRKIMPFMAKNEKNRGDFVPIEIDVVRPRTYNQLLFASGSPKLCPKFEEFRNQSAILREKGWRLFQDPIQKLNQHVNDEQKITDISRLKPAWDALMADAFEKRNFPGNITDMKIIKGIDYAHSYDVFVTELAHESQRQILSFHLLRRVLKHMANFREGKEYKKLVLFGGHDINLYIPLSAFGVITEECLLANYKDELQGNSLSYPNCQYPGFASNLIFELYNDTSAPYVKFLYNQQLVRLCGNQKDYCSYDEFVAFVENAYGHLTLESWNERCGVRKNEILHDNFNEMPKLQKVLAQIKNIWIVIGPIALIFFGFALVIILKRSVGNKWNPLSTGKPGYMMKQEDEDEMPDQSADSTSP